MIANGRIQLFPLLRLAVALIVGIFVGDAAFRQVPSWCWMAATVGLLSATCLLWRRPLWQGGCLLTTVALLGAWLIDARKQSDRVALPAGEVEYRAIVLTRPVERGRVVACDLLICEGPFSGQKLRASILRDNVELRYLAIREGDVLLAYSRLEQPKNFRPASNFDYRRWMEVHGYLGTTFIYFRNWQPSHSTLASLSRLQRLQWRLLRLRGQLRSRFDRADADDGAVAVVSAMALGDKTTLSRDLKETYSITGASHVLALSGLHLGIIYFLLTLFLPSRRYPAVAQAIAVVAMWAYAVMVGLMPSVVRAATMYSLYALVSLLRRETMSLNTLAFAAIVMLVANPLTLWDVGFQMSFMAVLGIVLFFRPLSQIVPWWWLNRHRILKWGWSMVCVSLAAQLLVAPLVLFYFGRFSSYFLLTNFVAVPLTTIIIYGAVLVFALTPLPMLQAWLMKALFAVATVLNRCLEWLSALPGASVEGSNNGVVQLLLLYVLLASLCGLTYYAVRMYRSAHGKPWGNYDR